MEPGIVCEGLCKIPVLHTRFCVKDVIACYLHILKFFYNVYVNGFLFDVGSEGNNARRDFLNYALSLMRSHNNEHSDSLPVIDIASLRHVAYVFDALIYYMRSGTDTDTDVLKVTIMGI